MGWDESVGEDALLKMLGIEGPEMLTGRSDSSRDDYKSKERAIHSEFGVWACKDGCEASRWS